MPWEAWFTLGVVVLIIFALARSLAGPDVIMLGGLTLLMTVGAITGSTLLPNPATAVRGFGNDGLITVGVLYVVTMGLTQTGALAMAVLPLMGRPTSVPNAQLRLMIPVATLSAFLNNTPVVAMFMPVVSDWCKKLGFPPSRFFIPLSYAAIVGGTCTLIGTSTNLVVYGMLEEFSPDSRDRIGLFSLAWVGVPICIVTLLYVLLLSRKLLPDRSPPRRALEDPKQYTIEMLIEPGSTIDGKTIEQAGLRNLPEAYLMEIERHGERIVAVGPDQILRAGDRLIFVGVVESVVDLQRIRGLVPATNQVFKLTDPRPNRIIIEAVVSDTCPIVGKTIKEGQFRSRYNAVVIAVHRNGHRLTDRKIGDIVLRTGDTLLIEAAPRFVDQNRNSRDFYLVSAVSGGKLVRHDKAWTALVILAGMVIAAGTGWLSMLNAAIIAAGLMVVTRCCTGPEARQSIDLRVLLVIGAALGVGNSLSTSGAAARIATELISLVQGKPWVALAMVYLVTVFFTEIITHTAAAVLVLPIAIAAANGLDADALPFAITVMIAASAGFATPIGYVTNLMVYGPGGYRFTDYLRFGGLLDFIVMAITVTLVPMIWPLTKVVEAT
jgi:di/tricarboxylate transporter